MNFSSNSGKFTSQPGRFNYFRISGGAPVPPPEPLLLVTDDDTYIVTDDGTFIEVV